jgi:hypothetical protein
MITFFKIAELAGIVFVTILAISNVYLIKVLKEINFRQQSKSGTLLTE